MRLAQHFACANGIAICIKSIRDSIGQGARPRHFLLFSGRVIITQHLGPRFTGFSSLINSFERLVLLGWRERVE